jgi:hypothetical protein
MRNGRRCARFPQEALMGERVVRRTVPDHLDSHSAVELTVDGFVNDSHTPFTEAAHELIA